MHRSGLTLWLWCACTPLFAAPMVPGDFSAHYVVKKGPIELGTARRSLRNVSPHVWVYESETNSTGGVLGVFFKLHEIKLSRIVLANELLQVESYEHTRKGNNPTALKQHYAWDKGRVTTQWQDGEVVTYELVPRAYDQNMYQLAVMMDLAQGQTSMTYQLAENRRIKTYTITEVRRERIKTTIGDFNAHVVVNRDKSAETMMWCAEELNYLPVRIEYEDNGIRINALITRVEGLGR
ncbi:MAG: DUF3108 domain-containing protein [Gammaproteobacteria bacterium]|nr:DUF3108 domain-containing protein [Gammaproteobacteria bacterium]